MPPRRGTGNVDAKPSRQEQKEELKLKKLRRSLLAMQQQFVRAARSGARK